MPSSVARRRNSRSRYSGVASPSDLTTNARCACLGQRFCTRRAIYGIDCRNSGRESQGAERILHRCLKKDHLEIDTGEIICRNYPDAAVIAEQHDALRWPLRARLQHLKYQKPIDQLFERIDPYASCLPR